jgi:hypothetical protein
MTEGPRPYSAQRRAVSVAGALLCSSMVLSGCGVPNYPLPEATAGMPSAGGGAGAAAGSGSVAGAAGTGAGTAGTAGAGGVSPAGGGGGMPPAGAGGDGAGLGGLAGAGAAGAGAGGVAGDAGAAGQAGAPNLPPANLSETGLFTGRDAMGELVPATGVRAFQPKYWLWSDGSDKRRYVYLPPGTQVDTTDPDHWVFPVGTKFWKSFISGGQLVETRLIERLGDGPNDFRYSTYAWATADATDATRMDYKNQRINAAGTTHDIPNGVMCERCHNGIKDRVLGFSALQLNHALGGVTLQTLLDEALLTVPIPTTIKMPGNDQATQDAVGYLHANCGNCHNDSPGLPVESVPQPQLLMRVSVNDMTLEDTGVYRTAVNQRTTAGAELGIDYRILGGMEAGSALYYRMGLRMIEDQMPPIGTEMTDMDGMALIRTFIQSFPPPTQ